jgi:hypothetical protein
LNVGATLVVARNETGGDKPLPYRCCIRRIHSKLDHRSTMSERLVDMPLYLALQSQANSTMLNLRDVTTRPAFHFRL